MSLIKIYRTPTTTNERLPTEQQNGYHGFETEQFIEGEHGGIPKEWTWLKPTVNVCVKFNLYLR